ncbi:MAG TPA: MotA/TolQ/ExbB proton channel family protein [Myxococcaceae bacterium]|nr:MotA/TolQ/ExbB proton channel family protein [Myxococcaceae bacterium]
MTFSIVELWDHMGLFARVINIFMAIMSVTTMIVLAERLILFRKSRNQSRQFAEKMAALLQKGDLNAAANANVGKDVGYLGRTIGAGLTAYRVSQVGSSKENAVESVARGLERQAQREVQTLKRGLGILGTIASTSPFIGLLGTVMGIVTAFQLMSASGSGGLGTVSAGISEALVATAFGLLVAIPAVMAYNYCQAWVDARAVDISESSNEFLDMVARHLQAQG